MGGKKQRNDTVLGSTEKELAAHDASPRTPRKEGTQERREFIVQYLRGGRTKLPIAVLEEHLKKSIHPESLKKDLEAFNNVGLRFVKENDAIVDLDAQHTGSSEDREDVNHAQKHLTAELAVSLILGFPHGWRLKPRVANRPALDTAAAPQEEAQASKFHKALYSQDEILGMLMCCEIGKKARERLRSTLLDYWHESSRLISLDAGTTNLKIAEMLTDYPMPLWDTQLSYLTGTTNSRLIFQKLGDPQVPIRTIIIGGQQRGRTSAIAGTLSEIFVKSTGLLNFGMTIVGATGVSARNRVCFSDTQEEAVLKGLLFSKSGLKVVAVDNSKLAMDSFRHAYSFCPLEPRSVDVIVTNSPILPAHLDKRSMAKMEVRWALKAYEEFEAIVQDIEAQGIPVLVAESPKTKPFRYERAKKLFRRSMEKQSNDANALLQDSTAASIVDGAI